MRRIAALILVVLTLAAVLCGCGSTPDTPDNGDPVSTPGADKAGSGIQKGGEDAVSTTLPGTFEIAATEPHYIIATPDWHAEGYGLGFALNEKGNKQYAIVVACGAEADEGSLQEAFQTLYNDTFNGILMQNYRAKYAEFTPATTETKLADGSPALRFEDIQPANDYGTELNCPVYGYGFRHDGLPFIVAYIVVEESAADDAKRAEMQGYVDEMVNTVRAAR